MCTCSTAGRASSVLLVLVAVVLSGTVVEGRTLAEGAMNFISTYASGPRGEREVKALVDGVHMLRLTGDDSSEPAEGLTSTQLTDGERLLYLVQDVTGSIVDCGIQRDAGRVATFLSNFYEDLGSSMVTSVLQGDTGNLLRSFMRRLTRRVFRYLTADDPALSDITNMVDMAAAEESCQSFLDSRIAEIVKANAEEVVETIQNSDPRQIVRERVEEVAGRVASRVDGLAEQVASRVEEATDIVEGWMSSIQNSVESGSPERVLSRAKRLTMPGTNWCGSGDRATAYDDLGDHSATDQCCRVHDQCPLFIRSMQTEFELFNYRLHTLSSCDCDDSFYECLRSANTTASNTAGRIFFNVVGTGCFDIKLQRTCVETGWFGYCRRHGMKYVASYREPRDYMAAH